MKNYIKQSNSKVIKEWKEWFLFKKIPIYILNNFNPNISIINIIKIIEVKLKKKYLNQLEAIYIGNIPFLKDRNIQAMFKDGVIYVSNFENDLNITEEKISKDIIHEVGHLLEYTNNIDIYGDSLIQNEFIGKRKRLYDILSNEGIKFSRSVFLSTPEYSEEIDNFLYKTIGYEKLNPLIIGLFLSPYCVTSINEYFANGFEEYQTGDQSYLKSISPVLFSKIKLLDKII